MLTNTNTSSNTSYTTAGHRLPYNHRQKVYDNGTLEVYHIERATDEGLYTCIAKNKKGQTAQSSVYVRVQSQFPIVCFTSDVYCIRCTRFRSNLFQHFLQLRTSFSILRFIFLALCLYVYTYVRTIPVSQSMSSPQSLQWYDWQSIYWPTISVTASKICSDPRS